MRRSRAHLRRAAETLMKDTPFRPLRVSHLTFCTRNQFFVPGVFPLYFLSLFHSLCSKGRYADILSLFLREYVPLKKGVWVLVLVEKGVQGIYVNLEKGVGVFM